jgi:LCP family protein required for cell wall assembly
VAISPTDYTPPQRPKLRRTWPQRFVLTFNIVVVLVVLGAAGGLIYARSKDHIKRYDVQNLTEFGANGDAAGALGDGKGVKAQNWLITGSDNRSCVDKNSRFAGAFLASDVEGERSDTVMVMRIDPAHHFSAILSFPRDLFVKIGGTQRQAKINSAYDGANPNRLIATINDNFHVPITHWMNVDFCAFKELVDAVGGVGINFTYPTRDLNTGLNVPVSGCHHMPGEEALAYVRSRHYTYSKGKKTKSGKTQWIEDPSGDFGRIRRQQQFIKIVAQKALDAGVSNPATFNRILDAVIHNIGLDANLSNGDLADIGASMVHLDPNATKTFMFQGDLASNNGESIVRIPTSGAEKAYNDSIVRIFKGEALPDSVNVATPPTESVASTSPTTAAGVAPGSTAVSSDDDLEVIKVNEPDPVGIVPPVDNSCK